MLRNITLKAILYTALILQLPAYSSVNGELVFSSTSSDSIEDVKWCEFYFHSGYKEERKACILLKESLSQKRNLCRSYQDREEIDLYEDCLLEVSALEKAEKVMAPRFYGVFPSLESGLFTTSVPPATTAEVGSRITNNDGKTNIGLKLSLGLTSLAITEGGVFIALDPTDPSFWEFFHIAKGDITVGNEGIHAFNVQLFLDDTFHGSLTPRRLIQVGRIQGLHIGMDEQVADASILQLGRDIGVKFGPSMFLLLGFDTTLASVKGVKDGGKIKNYTAGLLFTGINTKVGFAPRFWILKDGKKNLLIDAHLEGHAKGFIAKMSGNQYYELQGGLHLSAKVINRENQNPLKGVYLKANIRKIYLGKDSDQEDFNTGLLKTVDLGLSF